MGLDSNIAAVVAALDVKLVRLVRGAMNNGPGGGAAPAGLVGPAATIEPRPVITPEPRIEPRPVIHPTPRFEPRPVIHPEPRIDAPNYPCVVVEVVADTSDSNGCPIQPPWRVLPWESAAPAESESLAQPVRRVKPPIRRPDIVCRGTLIDLFC